MKKHLFAITAVLFTLHAFSGCTASKDNAASDKICEPGKEYHCQCVNKDEGTHVCADDGKSYDACLPCYGDEVIGDDDPPYVYDYDAATEYPDEDTGVTDAGPGAAACGNGVVETDEQCDDKNTKANDGCSDTCKVEGKVLGTGPCPGLPVHVWGSAVTFDATTVGFPNSHTSSPTCGPSGMSTSGAAALDRTFAVTAHKTGSLTVTTSKTTVDHLLVYTSKACPVANPLTYEGCAYDPAKTSGQTLSFNVTSGATYIVIVDSKVAQGAFTISFEIK